MAKAGRVNVENSACASAQNHTIDLVFQPSPEQMTGPNLTGTETVKWAWAQGYSENIKCLWHTWNHFWEGQKFSHLLTQNQVYYTPALERQPAMKTLPPSTCFLVSKLKANNQTDSRFSNKNRSNIWCLIKEAPMGIEGLLLRLNRIIWS